MAQFLQWDPSANNLDPGYPTNTLRANGATTNATFPSNTANSLFYQLSTFITAFANVLTAKGFVVDDASLSQLQTVLSKILTQADNPAVLDVLQVASLTSTTGIRCDEGIQSGVIAGQDSIWPNGHVGLYAVVDGTFQLHNGFTGPLTTAIADGLQVIGGIIVGDPVPR